MERKQKSAVNMMKTFSEGELDYIVDVMKGFKSFEQRRQNGSGDVSVGL